MTKRFTPKASTYTERLSKVQAEMLIMKKKLSALQEEERSLQAFLIPFYDQGQTEVEVGSQTLTVQYSESERTYLDQQKARNLIAKLGRKAPEFTSTVVTFKVSK